MKKVIFKYCLILIFLTAFINSATGITAGFSYTKVSNCAPTIVRFTNSSSSGPGITYIWNFGLGAVVTANDNSSKEQVYTKSGNYTVTLKVTDGVNTDSTSMTIAIAMGPAAGFTADKVIGCAPLTVNLTSSSTAGDAEITKTLWDFRNGVYKEGLSVQNSYSNTGTYDLNLTVTDKNGCSSILSSEKVITVTEKPHVSFAASDTFACRPPLSVYYTNNSTGASDLAWKWNFGNGENSSELSGSSVYRINGNYSVKLTATDLYGCSDSLLRKSYITVGYPKGTLSVYDANGIKVDKSYLCNGSYVFKYSTTGLPEYIWKITEEGKTSVINGTDSLMYKVEGSGSIDIKVVYGKSSFCTDSASISFVKSYVKADFTIGDTLLCMLPSVIKLKSSSQNTDSLAWYFSGRLFSNNDTADYTVNRKDMPAETWEQLYSHKINYVKFPVKLVASIGRACYDSIKKNITIALPRARFMPDKVSGCIPLQVTFSDSSKSVNSVDSYKFKIGSDSVTSTVKSPVSYTFTKAGEYDVTEIISSRGCIDTSMNIRIVAGDKLTPDFTITPGEVCNDGIVHLTGDTGNNSLVNTWRFRSPDLFDISFSSRPDSDIVVYTDTPGLHNVSLMADYNGCQSETSKTGILKINGPAGSFKETMSCDSSLIYQFKSTMSPATSYLWKIGNDTIANTDSVKYKFPLNVNYLVQLTATDAGSNCSLTRSKIIKVRKVVSAFTVSDSTICVGDTVRLYSTKSQDYISNCYNEGFLWNFGDDSPPRRAFETKYDHIYSVRGTDTISLVTIGENGCTDTVKKIVRVFHPTGSFISDKTLGCVPGMTVKFTNTSTDTTIISWVWNFGDKTSDSTNTASINHSYTNKEQKTYYPTLTVYDAYQCYSSQSIPTFLKAVDGGFQASDNTICAGTNVVFTPSDTTLTSFLWTFGDGSSPAATGSHTYSASGTYDVSLTASDGLCSSSVTKTAYISVEKASALFTPIDSIFSCYPDSVHFVYNDPSASTPVDYLWKFGSNYLQDRSSGSVDYTFVKPGTYPVQLTINTLNGCSASSAGNIQVNGPNAYVSIAPRVLCYNDAVTFNIDSLKDVSTWKLLFGDGASNSTDNPATHKYSIRGTVTPSIQLKNSTCTAILLLDSIKVSKVEAGFVSGNGKNGVCIGNKLTLVNQSAYSDSWNWFINGLPVANSFNLNNYNIGKTGDYSIRLVARESGGCTDTLTKIFPVVDYPVFTITGDSILCSGSNFVTLSVNKNLGDVIIWTPSQGITDPAAFSVNVKPASTTIYSAMVTGIYGCSTTKQKEIRVNEPFDLKRIPLGDTTVYLGDKVQLNLITSAGNVTYSWKPAYNISCESCSDPWVSPGHTTIYTVEARNGCFDLTENFNVEVLADFYLEAPKAFTPNGDSNNDIFLFEQKNISSFNLKIFNRWGEIVYSTNDIQKGWDGYVNGHLQNVDTYEYIVKATTVHGFQFEKRGEFLLLK